MMNRKGSMPRHVDPEQALEALRDSRKRYEGSKRGKRSRKRWKKENRDKLNAYKREWRKRRKLERSGVRAAAF